MIPDLNILGNRYGCYDVSKTRNYYMIKMTFKFQILSLTQFPDYENKSNEAGKRKRT